VPLRLRGFLALRELYAQTMAVKEGVDRGAVESLRRGVAPASASHLTRPPLDGFLEPFARTR